MRKLVTALVLLVLAASAGILDWPQTLALTPTPPPAPTPIPYEDLIPVGDADCSGSLTSVDALAILQYESGLVAELCWLLRNAGVEFGFDVDRHVGDLNDDGTIDARDARAILRVTANCLVPPPAVEPHSPCNRSQGP